MARNLSIRLSPEQLRIDEAIFTALKAMKDYVPANPDYSIEKLTAKNTEMHAAQEAEINTQNAMAAARDAAVATQWENHDNMLAAKDQVIALFGPDSDQVASLGLKKKSERKMPARTRKAATRSPS